MIEKRQDFLQDSALTIDHARRACRPLNELGDIAYPFENSDEDITSKPYPKIRFE